MTSAGCNTPEWDLRTGDWREVLADVTPDVVITDPPYSERTIAGQVSGDYEYGEGVRKTIDYNHVSRDDGRDLLRWVEGSGAQWLVAFGDHVQWGWYDADIESKAWRAYQPVPWIKPRTGTPRMFEPGPCCSTEWIFVARLRGSHPSRWMPGHYAAERVTNGMNTVGVTGSKPTPLMRRIVRDYSMPGDLIADPYAGSGTTILAALLEGRRAIGAEIDPERAEMARERIERETMQTQLWAPGSLNGKQEALP